MISHPIFDEVDFKSGVMILDEWLIYRGLSTCEILAHNFDEIKNNATEVKKLVLYQDGVDPYCHISYNTLFIRDELQLKIFLRNTMNLKIKYF